MLSFKKKKSVFSCTLDDAAIYQVSASNSKGIVSCSGVLEVGDMNEYKIHQRFFSKLKQKAENKKKADTEPQSKKKEDKENIQKKMQISPERPPRKRHVPPPVTTPAIREAAAVEHQGAAAGMNGVNTEGRGAGNAPSKDNELDKDEALSEKVLATKKLKISNGVDAGVNSSNLSGKSQELRNGGENCYDGGISLAQFLAETLQSQTSEEKQSSEEGDRSPEMDLTALNVSKDEGNEKEDMRKEREEEEKRQQEESERQKRRDEELATEKAREQIGASQMEGHTEHGSETKQHSKAHKDHEPHNIQASISSMLHSVKDFLFGKSKKDSPDHLTNKEREVCHLTASQAEMPPSFQLQQESQQLSRPVTEDAVTVEISKTKEPREDFQVQDMPLGLQGSRQEGRVLRADQPPANKSKLELVEGSMGQSVKMANDAAEAMQISVVPQSCSPGEEMPLSGQVLTEVCAMVLHSSWVLLETLIYRPHLFEWPAQDELLQAQILQQWEAMAKVRRWGVAGLRYPVFRIIPVTRHWRGESPFKLAFTYDEATLLHVGGKANQKDKKGRFLSTCGGGGCCVPAERIEKISHVGCDVWDTSASELMMKPECQRQFSGYNQGLAGQTAAGSARVGGERIQWQVSAWQEGLVTLEAFLPWGGRQINCAYKNNQASIAIAEVCEMSEITQSTWRISLRKSYLLIMLELGFIHVWKAPVTLVYIKAGM